MRFPEFTEQWEEKKLGEVATIIGGGTPDTNIEEYWNGNIQWFTPTEIKSNYVSKSSKTISELGLKQSSAKLLPVGAILLTTRATIGEVAIATEECTTNQGFQSLVVNKEVDNIFVSNWIKQNKREFVKRANGSTFSEISKTEIEDIPILIPLLPEQAKIASFLTLIDERIATQSKIIEGLKRLKASLSKQIFNRKLRFKDENENDFAEWEELELGDCLDYIQPTQYIVNNTVYNDKYKTPVLTAGKSFILGYTNEKNDIYKENLPVIIFDDFTTATQFVDFPFKVKSSAMKILIAKETADAKFMYEYLNSIQYEIGGHERHWISKFHPMTVTIPFIQEQAKIANFLSSIDSKIEVETQMHELLTKQKQYFLQQMFI